MAKRRTTTDLSPDEQARFRELAHEMHRLHCAASSVLKTNSAAYRAFDKFHDHLLDAVRELTHRDPPWTDQFPPSIPGQLPASVHGTFQIPSDGTWKGR